eukprot:8239594-Ditylum_brightwellii.AAC.1
MALRSCLHSYYEYKVIDIRCQIDMGDKGAWMAKFAWHGVPYEYHYHAIDVTGSSISNFGKELDMYHAKISCNWTKKTRE